MKKMFVFGFLLLSAPSGYAMQMESQLPRIVVIPVEGVPYWETLPKQTADQLVGWFGYHARFIVKKMRKEGHGDFVDSVETRKIVADMVSGKAQGDGGHGEQDAQENKAGEVEVGVDQAFF